MIQVYQPGRAERGAIVRIATTLAHRRRPPTPAACGLRQLRVPLTSCETPPRTCHTHQLHPARSSPIHWRGLMESTTGSSRPTSAAGLPSSPSYLATPKQQASSVCYVVV
ncbi:hypothetical protein PsYK624_162850 [Phanerochaete sordida]|uniref:Uncharacterized protein n=1 Tax=Phanerochaete sordida TaxID=48140 RepID=A0A9P3GQL8_9APHY|nr:hypothetical protein PsYK624_162850 [Phanerochaete sordida]